MLYLVGGCARSGKSSLAERMRRRHGVPWFALDGLKMGLSLGAPDLGVDPNEDDLLTADLMWPIVKGLLDNLLFDGRDYLVEGVNLRPATVAAFIGESDADIRACFLGYPRLSAPAKAEYVIRHGGLPNDWLNRMDADFIDNYLRACVQLSIDLERDCLAAGLSYFDTGDDFEAGLTRAEQFLVGGDRAEGTG